ncbi:MAG: hypothetical protein R8G33_02720 [Gammaproteobacteria bacterium]|nr:hypothetical protein [Gammaproteobacteria bacterium]
MVYHPDLGYVENGIDFTDTGLYKTAIRDFGQATILPSFSYQSKIFSDLEDEKLWTRSWIAIGTTHQIPNIGDLLPFTVGRHGLHVQRQEDGSLIGRFNKAQHGGCRAIPAQCQTGKKTKCSFTSCGYSRDRQTIRVEEIGENTPTMHQYLGLIPERLLPVKVETLGPYIFVNLDPDSKSLNEEFSSIPESIDFNSITNLDLQTDQWFECASNWKLIGRAFYDSDNNKQNLEVKELSQDTTHFHATDVLISEADNNDNLLKADIYWLFPNLLIVDTLTHIFSVILQPTSMQESLLRACVFNKNDTDQGNDSIPKEILNFIELIQSRTKSFQDITGKINSPSSSELNNKTMPLENNIAGYVFQKYVAKTVTTMHEYYWNAPLFTNNPVA